MSYYYVVQPPRRTRTAGLFVIAGAVALLGVIVLAGWAAAQPLRVTVDGVVHFVPRGTDLEELKRTGVLAAPGGRLIGIDGSVVDGDGGEPPSVTRNGEPALLSQQLFPGDEIVSSPGADRSESIVVTDVAMPFATRYIGNGPLTEMRTLGSPGLRRVTRGEVSGIEITSTVIREPSDMVVARTRPTGKVVALTFDDGPWPGQTDRILRVLDKADVKATFFMLGIQVSRNPAVARRVARAGHSVASHTYNHKKLDGVPPARVRLEIRKGRMIIKRVTGHDTPLIRPPYGAMNSRSWSEARRLDAKVVLWDVDSRDWTKPGTKRIENTVVSHVRPGSVVLLHDGGGNRNQTIAALPGIIRRLKKKGYTFVTVEELSQLRAEAAARKRAAKKAAGKKKG